MPTPALDLDALRAAHEPWTFSTGGRTYTARPVSVEQVIAHEAECVGASPAAVMRARRRLLRLAFPWRPSFLWRGDPVRAICSASPALHRVVMDSFFVALQSSFPRSATPATPPSSSS